MGITFLTAMIIQSRGGDIRCSAARNEKSGKWVGFVNLYKGDDYDHMLLSSDPCYASEEEAIEAMKGVVTEVRKAKLGF